MMGYINAPKKVIAYVIQDSAEDYSEALNYLKTVKFDYLVVPTVETDEQTTAVVSYVKAQRAANKLIKAVLPNTTGDNEGIIAFDVSERDGRPVFYLKVSTGSTDNLKPELVLEAMFQAMGYTYDQNAIQIHRRDVYAMDTAGDGFISLGKMGEVIG